MTEITFVHRIAPDGQGASNRQSVGRRREQGAYSEMCEKLINLDFNYTVPTIPTYTTVIVSFDNLFTVPYRT